MGIRISVKQGESPLSLQDIADLSGLAYGKLNSQMVLEKGKLGDLVVLYDPEAIGRGFEAELKDDEILLNIPLPATGHEIQIFYQLADTLCKTCGQDSFIRENERISIHDQQTINMHILEDIQTCSDAIMKMDDEIQDGQHHVFYIFAALNPIELGKEEFNKMGRSLEGYANVLHTMQKDRYYYSHPHYYKRDDNSIYALYFIGINLDTVIPVSPVSYAYLKPNFECNDFFVFLPQGHCILFDDFIRSFPFAKYYDPNHIRMSVTERQIYRMVLDYEIDEMTLGSVINPFYRGPAYDDDNPKCNVTDKNLDTHPIQGFNHMAVYLQWMIDHDMVNDLLYQRIPQLHQAEDLRYIIQDSDYFNGTLSMFHFTEEGQNFTGWYYRFGFPDGYPSCVDNVALSMLGSERYHCEEYQDEAYLFVPYNEEYKKLLSAEIDKAYQQYQKEKE